MGLLDKLFHRQPQIVYFQPTRPHAETERHPTVNLQQVTLRVSELVLAQNISTDDLSRLIYALEACLRERFATSAQAFELRILTVIYPDRPVDLIPGTTRPIKGLKLQAIRDALQALEVMQVQTKRDPVMLDAYFEVNTAVAS